MSAIRDCGHLERGTIRCGICWRDDQIDSLRDRLEAAEALLRELRIRMHASGRRPEECWEMSEIDAHFARYAGKD